MSRALSTAVGGSALVHVSVLVGLGLTQTPQTDPNADQPEPMRTRAADPAKPSQELQVTLVAWSAPDSVAVPPIQTSARNADTEPVGRQAPPIANPARVHGQQASVHGSLGSAPLATPQRTPGEMPTAPAPPERNDSAPVSMSRAAESAAAKLQRRARPSSPGPLAMRAPPPIPRAGGLGRSHRPREKSNLSPRSGGRARASDGLVHAQVSEDGSIESISGPAPVSFSKGIFRFDLTDAVMASVGQDPYSARKLKLLDETRAQRHAMAASATKRRLKGSLARIRGDLSRLWKRADLAEVRRRRLIFELWDECAESGPRQQVETARAIRASIEAFVRQRLPRGGSTGYSEAELSELNRKRSSEQRFAPYR